MGVSIIPRFRVSRQKFVMLSIALAMVMTLILVQAITAAEELAIAPNLSGSSKSVNLAETTPGSTLQYTIVISNSGGLADVMVTDNLPISVTENIGSMVLPTELNVITDGFGESTQLITWTGKIGAQSLATIKFNVTVTDTVLAGQSITNLVEITGTGSLLTREAGTLIVAEPPTKTTFIPGVSYSFPTVVLNVSKPNSSNQWTVSWGDTAHGVTGYELQESQDPNFTTQSQYNHAASTTSRDFNHGASFNNVYYYRARAVVGTSSGAWSDVVQVVGAYRDDFDDPGSGWASRRMSFLEKTDAKYGTGAEAGNLIVLSFDKWDWVLASPFRPAPELPYVVEYRSRVHDAGNLVSGGAVIGGDWNGQACPEVGNVYQTTNCFNHFYNVNTIWFGGLKVLFERVDYLYYCPGCMGSQLKRLSHDESTWFTQDIQNEVPLSWNTWRVEVRETGLRFYANGQLYATSNDNTWVNEPYFGVFASTDEYKPSIWFFDYYSVTPLDS